VTVDELAASGAAAGVMVDELHAQSNNEAQTSARITYAI
jgi:hypothetical protein